MKRYCLASIGPALLALWVSLPAYSEELRGTRPAEQRENQLQHEATGLYGHGTGPGSEVAESQQQSKPQTEVAALQQQSKPQTEAAELQQQAADPRRSRAAQYAPEQERPLREEAHTVHWSGRPLSVELRPGRERVVFFPGRVRVRVPRELSALLRTQIVHRAVYWTALDHFATRRIVVHQEPERGSLRPRVYLLDLSATPRGSAEALRIRSAHDSVAHTVAPGDPSNPPEMVLTRYAAQRLYAPARLAPQDAAIRRLPLRTEYPDLPLLRGALLHWRILGAWRGYGLYLTAVQLENRMRRPLVLDARRLRGNWRAVTFQHRKLQPRDTTDAGTVAYLVSLHPFGESLLEEPQWRDPACCG